MNSIIGYSVFGDTTCVFKSPSSPARNINLVELSNMICDEIQIRERTDVNTNISIDNWQTDTRLLAKFKGNLEAGNIDNGGIPIETFAIKRRGIDELDDITLGYMPFVNNSKIEYIDVTQKNDTMVYSIVPVGINNIEGAPNSITIESDFVGWWLVDKSSNHVLAFDKAIGNVENVDTSLIQGRVQIDALTKYPDFYYSPLSYHSFTLRTVIIPSEFERTGHDYKRVIENIINSSKLMMVKSDTGRIFVCDVSNPRLSSPLNTWKGSDYGVLTLDFTEAMDYKEFMSV